MLNDNVNPVDYPYPDVVRLGSALVPGLMMTPISSILGEFAEKSLQNFHPAGGKAGVYL